MGMQPEEKSTGHQASYLNGKGMGGKMESEKCQEHSGQEEQKKQ